MQRTITVADVLKMARDHHKAGRTAEAEGVCRKLLSHKPDQPDALQMLGYLIADRSPDEGAEMIRRAIELNPNNADFHNNLGCVLFNAKKHEQAIEAYRRAISLRDDYLEAYNNLASVFLDKSLPEDALNVARRAVEVRDTSHRAWFLLGQALRMNQQCAEAEKAYRRSIELKPDFLDEHTNLGLALRDLARFDEARAVFLRAIAMKPDSACDHWNYALTLLRSGDYLNGFIEYEWRWNWNGFPGKRLVFPQPQWCGTELAGKTIYVHAEQGLGDWIQMSRYIPLLSERVAKVVLSCSPELRDLFATLDGNPQIRVTGESIGPFDTHIPAMSLPLAFDTTTETIPWRGPYLRADAQLSRTWAARLSRRPDERWVGLVWAGQPKHGDDRLRSLSLRMLAPLGQMETARFVSLQKGMAADQIATAPANLNLMHVGDELLNFADTAAVIDHLDLVITVDTAVAHLAGAMGKRCWVLLSSVPDWRWMLNRDDSPWYPTIRLFRQQPGQSWEPVIERVARELSYDNYGR